MVAVALAQLATPPRAVQANVEHALERAEFGFRSGADIVVLPELVTTGYFTERDELERLAEPESGATWQRFARLASGWRGVVVYGTCERAGDQIYNTVYVVGDGRTLVHYRKLHLFAAERHCFTPGDLGLPVVDVRGVRLGVCICYDLRFPEVLRVLALRGADLVVAPAAWVGDFDGAVHDELPGVVPQARNAAVQANLNQVAVVAVSQVGPGLLGGSLACDGYGRFLCDPLPLDDEAVTLVDVDIEQVRRSRERGADIRPRADRRTDVYQLAYCGEPL